MYTQESQTEKTRTVIYPHQGLVTETGLFRKLGFFINNLKYN